MGKFISVLGNRPTPSPLPPPRPELNDHRLPLESSPILFIAEHFFFLFAAQFYELAAKFSKSLKNQLSRYLSTRCAALPNLQLVCQTSAERSAPVLLTDPKSDLQQGGAPRPPHPSFCSLSSFRGAPRGRLPPEPSGGPPGREILWQPYARNNH